MLIGIVGLGLLILVLGAARFMYFKENADLQGPSAPPKSSVPANAKTASEKTSGTTSDARSEQKITTPPTPLTLSLEAQRMLRQAREFAQENPTHIEDIVGRYAQVSLKYPGTPEAKEAVQEAEPYRAVWKALKLGINP